MSKVTCPSPCCEGLFPSFSPFQSVDYMENMLLMLIILNMLMMFKFSMLKSDRVILGGDLIFSLGEA